MATAAAIDSPLIERWSRARQARDARFDGMFIVAVKSTGIYCRPICPAPLAREANVRYFAHAAAAAAAGFRPCLRCRPERAPGLRSAGEQAFDLALKQVGEGYLAEHSVAELAQRVGLSERQLRRQFEQRMGLGPLALHANQRLLLAKQLLAETALSVTDVALASGYNSLRRFNQTFRDACGMPPTALRRQLDRAPAADAIELLLGYRPPYDYAALLEFLAARALPGVEWVEDGRWIRRLSDGAELSVSQLPERNALRLRLCSVKPVQIPELLRRVRRVFDVDADPAAIGDLLAADPPLALLLAARPGLRLPGVFDGFEGALRAILGQQVSVAAARTFALRLIEQTRRQFPGSMGLPTPAQLAALDCSGLGLTGKRIATLKALSSALLDRRIELETAQSLLSWIASLQQIPGVGPWTAEYMAMRVLHHPDAFPAGDLVVRKAMAAALGADKPISERVLRQHAERWRPWRGYAVIHLWRYQVDASRKRQEN